MADPATPLRYPIRAVARMTGLSVDTLRAWERRYDAVVPSRGGRGRLYSDADVARLRQLGDLVRRGHAIGTIAGLPGADLDRLLKGPEPGGDGPAPSEHPRLATLIHALDRYDVDGIDAIVNRFAAVLPPRDLVFEVVMPLLEDVGRRWESGRLRPAQEHVVSSIVRSVLGGLLRATARPNASPKIVFATPAGERHELALLSAALLAASAGFGVVYLGADLPSEDIVHAAATSGARIVVVGLTTPKAVSRTELKRLADIGGGTELWVGGPQRDALLPSIGTKGRHVATLADLVPLLERHVR